MITLLLAAIAAVTEALPSYIAVPADQIAFIDLSTVRSKRVQRQILTPPPIQPLNFGFQDYQPVPIPVEVQPRSLQQDFQPIPIQQFTQNPRIALAPSREPPTPRYQPDTDTAPSQFSVQSPQKFEDESPSKFSNHAPSQFSDGPPDFGEYVDFGAHTGNNGAFGWYADYPVNDHIGEKYGR